MTAKSAEDTIVTNCFQFHRILREAHMALSQGKLAAAAGLAQYAGYFAWYNNTGYMASRELEDLLLEIGGKILPVSDGALPPPPKARGLKILHVLTTAYGAGGHTRLAWRWISRDKENRHAVIITQQGASPIPEQLEAATAQAGGMLINLEHSCSDLLERAHRLREAVELHDLVVLHLHPHDVVPTIALATLPERIPVIYLNHVSYVFWIGVSVTNLVVNLGQSCVEFCIERRGIPRESCSALLPIPIELPTPSCPREEVRQQLGVAPGAALIFSSGTAHKYTPTHGIDFRDFVRQALATNPDCHLLVAGPSPSDYWRQLEESAPGRIHLLGLVDETSHHNYCNASDIFLDSLPLGSGTSLLEAACLGLPVLTYAPTEWKKANISFEQDCLPRNLHYFDNRDDYIERLQLLVNDPAARRYYGNAAGSLVRRVSMGAVWLTLLSDIYRQAATRRRNRPMNGAIFPRIEETDLFCCRLQSAAGNTLPAEVPELTGDFEKAAGLLDVHGIGETERFFPYSYDRWILKRQFREIDFERIHERANRVWKNRPLFEFILVLHPGREHLLADTIDSLARQFYDGWRLSIFSYSPPPSAEFEGGESPLRWIRLSDDIPLGEAINTQLMTTPVDWIALVECGSQFTQHFLVACSDSINAHQDWRLVYFDDDTIEVDGRHSPLFKPDLNVDLLRSIDYVGNILVAREALLQIGGYGDSGAATRYDTTLRVLDAFGAEAIGHIADILCHVPVEVSPNATAPEMEPCLRRHFDRRGIAADLFPGMIPGQTQRIRYRHTATPEVSIIIPNRNSLDLLGPCIESLITQTRYPRWEILLIDNGSDDPNLLAYYDALSSALQGRVRVFHALGEFNYSAMNNLGAQAARGEYLLLLNNDTVAIHDDWLDVMMSHAQRTDIGIVGPRLLYPSSGHIQHAGIVLGMDGAAGHVFIENLSPDQPGYMNRALVEQNYSAVTGACLLVRASLYREVGGLDAEQLKVRYNDIDLCLKIRRLGYRILWTPYATLLHHGSATQRKENLDPEKGKAAGLRLQQETYHFVKRWRSELASDPAWNRNLSLVSTMPAIEDELAVGWNLDFHERVRILAMPLESAGQAEYRILAPLRALDSAGLADTASVCQPKPGYDRAPTPIELARLAPDTLLMHAPVDNTRCIALLHYKELNPDVLRIYSLDDLITDIPPDNPASQRLAPEVMHERLRLGLAASDRLIVSTAPLAELCRGMINDIRIIPNMLEKRRWEHLRPSRRGGPRPRIGWAGAQQHEGDLRLVIDVVKTTHTEIDWVFFGMLPEGAEPYIAEFHDFVRDFDDYPGKLASLDLDLAIAPLVLHPFNEAKSNLRLLEYGILGWPVVCTDIYPYRSGNPPVTRLANDAAAWIDCIRSKIRDRDALAEEGEALRAWVRASYLLEDHLDLWLSALTQQTTPATGNVAGTTGSAA